MSYVTLTQSSCGLWKETVEPAQAPKWQHTHSIQKGPSIDLSRCEVRPMTSTQPCGPITVEISIIVDTALELSSIRHLRPRKLHQPTERRERCDLWFDCSSSVGGGSQLARDK